MILVKLMIRGGLFFAYKASYACGQGVCFNEISDSFISSFSLLSRVPGNCIVPPFGLIFFLHFFLLVQRLSYAKWVSRGDRSVMWHSSILFCPFTTSRFFRDFIQHGAGMGVSGVFAWVFLFSFYLVATNEYSV